ncbi:SDR family oxidoreductase [Propionibacteriaceae bacterium Y1685]|uniref:SDR family oxidoreductase n=1 Tax=Microlunatus sp. Y1700 TaxID=3418487 RepID=UPI003B78BF4A
MNEKQENRVLVMGASGQVGNQVCRQLELAGAQVRAATRNPSRVGSSVETVPVDLGDPTSLVPALRDVDAVFLLWPFFESADEARRKVAPIAELLGAQVPRVVYVSSQGVEADRHNFWAVVEDAVAEHVQEWTMLRPTGFAANARQWIPQIADGRVVRWPFGDLARPLIHEADIAAVAVEALLGDGHQAEEYVLTGPEHITQREQVHQIGAAIGRPLEWEEISRSEAGRELDVPAAMLDGWENFLANPEPVTDVVERVTGRAPRSFADWAQDNADLFRLNR